MSRFEIQIAFGQSKNWLSGADALCRVLPVDDKSVLLMMCGAHANGWGLCYSEGGRILLEAAIAAWQAGESATSPEARLLSTIRGAAREFLKQTHILLPPIDDGEVDLCGPPSALLTLCLVQPKVVHCAWIGGVEAYQLNAFGELVAQNRPDTMAARAPKVGGVRNHCTHSIVREYPPQFKLDKWDWPSGGQLLLANHQPFKRMNLNTSLEVLELVFPAAVDSVPTVQPTKSLWDKWFGLTARASHLLAPRKLTPREWCHKREPQGTFFCVLSCKEH
jgi:hypothetical protein